MNTNLCMVQGVQVRKSHPGVIVTQTHNLEPQFARIKFRRTTDIAMKCPACLNQHQAKYGMKCSCGREFVFHRKTDGISDMRFLAVVRAASANDTYYFTLPQLHAEACRRMKRYVTWPFIAGVVVLAAATGVVCGVTFGGLPRVYMFYMVCPALLGLASCLFAVYEASKSAPPLSKWEDYVRRWMQAHGKQGLEKYIDQPGMHQPPPDWPEPDLYDYGFEKLIIVQRDILVDWLVLNNMHAGERALIVSETGYPRYLLEHATRTLAENPQLPVYILHDPAPEGDAMLQRVRNSSILPLAGRDIVDLGLSVADCKRMKGMKNIGADPGARDIPLDTLRYATLAGGVGAALATGVTLSYMLEQQAAAAQRQGGADAGNTGGESYYGFG